MLNYIKKFEYANINTQKQIYMLPCKQHLIAIYVIFVEESIDARLVWQNIGKKMSSYGVHRLYHIQPYGNLVSDVLVSSS